jgi:hypothetical protein
MKNIWEDAGYGEVGQQHPYAIEGTQILSEETSMKIRYVKRVTDATKFDPLFVKVFVVELALKMIIPLGGGGKGGEAIRRGLLMDLWGGGGIPGLMAQVRALDKQETETTTRWENSTWNAAMEADIDGDPARMNE